MTVTITIDQDIMVRKLCFKRWCAACAVFSQAVDDEVLSLVWSSTLIDGPWSVWGAYFIKQHTCCLEENNTVLNLNKCKFKNMFQMRLNSIWTEKNLYCLHTCLLNPLRFSYEPPAPATVSSFCLLICWVNAFRSLISLFFWFRVFIP